jgi:hypothetical protein
VSRSIFMPMRFILYSFPLRSLDRTKPSCYIKDSRFNVCRALGRGDMKGD